MSSALGDAIRREAGLRPISAMALKGMARQADIQADLLDRERDNTQHVMRANLDLIKRLHEANEKLEAIRAVHQRYFNTEVSAFEAAEDFAVEDTWRFDRDFREVLDGPVPRPSNEVLDELRKELKG